MSDDDLAYSPFDDFEDMLYDADPAPDLADDLAEHVANSPVWQDDPGCEVFDVHSDWEYYSDDFYDDDPALLKKNPQDGTPPRRVRQDTGSQARGERGRKRKLAETEDGATIDLGERKKLKDCIKGTVWSRPIPERHNTFHEGKEEKVALLKDWRKKFGTRMGKRHADGVTRPQLNRDESWANDMSLADMGLLSSRETMLGQEDNDQGDGEEPEEVEDGDYTENEVLEVEIPDGSTTISAPDPMNGQETLDDGSIGGRLLQTSDISTREIDDDHDPSTANHIRKRNKRTELPSPSTTASSSSQQTNQQSARGLSKIDPIGSVKNQNGNRKRKANDDTVDSESDIAAVDQQNNDQHLNVSAPPKSSASNTSHRQKRTASSKMVKSMAETTINDEPNSQAYSESDQKVTSSPSKRVTRSRKKG